MTPMSKNNSRAVRAFPFWSIIQVWKERLSVPSFFDTDLYMDGMIWTSDRLFLF